MFRRQWWFPFLLIPCFYRDAPPHVHTHPREVEDRKGGEAGGGLGSRGRRGRSRQGAVLETKGVERAKRVRIGRVAREDGGGEVVGGWTGWGLGGVRGGEKG